MLKCSIRAAQIDDIPCLIRHMRSLAKFEDYIDDFRVDEESLLKRAFNKHPECSIFVSTDDEIITGYVVMLRIHFTYSLKDTMIIKEFFIDSNYRGYGIGSALFRYVSAWAFNQGVGLLKWDVMTGNHLAEAFYMKHGAQIDNKWIPYVMTENAMKLLALQTSS